MSKNSRDNRPYVRPITRIELPEKNVRSRLILIVILLSIAVVAIGVGFTSLLSVEPGWNQIKAASTTTNCSVDFKLMYDFSGTGASANTMNKRLSNLYSDATVQAYRIFSPEYLEDGMGNIGYVNTHVNEEIAVEKTLYEAFSLLEQAGNRCVYLAPVYVEYNRIFSSESDILAAENDPGRNPEAKEYVDAIMHYAADPEHIRLELLGDNQVKLTVSEEYLTFAREQELEAFLDFGWMKNAFIADYIADCLEAEGFTHGYLSSYDGFTRNLDDRGGEYSLNLFDRQGTDIYLPAVMTYSGPRSIVALRDYPLDDMDVWHYYAYEDGEITSIMADPVTGMSRVSCDSLVSWSEEVGCAQILMEMIPLYLTDTFSESGIQALRQQGIHSLWYENNVLTCNDPQQALQILPDQPYSIAYTQ